MLGLKVKTAVYCSMYDVQKFQQEKDFLYSVMQNQFYKLNKKDHIYEIIIKLHF